jgi:hypothetical protein
VPQSAGKGILFLSEEMFPQEQFPTLATGELAYQPTGLPGNWRTANS